MLHMLHCHQQKDVVVYCFRFLVLVCPHSLQHVLVDPLGPSRHVDILLPLHQSQKHCFLCNQQLPCLRLHSMLHTVHFCATPSNRPTFFLLAVLYLFYCCSHRHGKIQQRHLCFEDGDLDRSSARGLHRHHRHHRQVQ